MASPEIWLCVARLREASQSVDKGESVDKRFAAAVKQHVDNAVVNTEDFSVGVQIYPAALMNYR